MSKHFFTALLVTTALATSIPAFADILSTTGSVEISTGSIAFYPLGGATGDYSVGPPDTGIFSGLVGTSGTITNLNSAAEPINTLVNIPDFMTFAGAPNLSLTLTELVGGTFATCAIPPPPPAAGQSCTPAGTPYNLTNLTPTSSSAAFTIDGFVVDTNNPTVNTAFFGIFTTQFANENFQQVINALETGGVVDATYSAQFITTPVTGTPEPGTMFSFLAGGLILLGIGSFGKRIHASKRV
jgi:hypothetical protein